MKQGDELQCRDCPETTVWKRRLLPDDWIVVLSDPPYSLCGPCREATQQARPEQPA